MALKSAPSVPIHGRSPHTAFGVPSPFVLFCFVLFSLTAVCERTWEVVSQEIFFCNNNRFAAGSHRITGARWRSHLSVAPLRVAHGLKGSAWGLVFSRAYAPDPQPSRVLLCLFTEVALVHGKGFCLLWASTCSWGNGGLQG